MAARQPFWKWRRWISIGSCLLPASICKWNFKLKFQSKIDLCSGSPAVYRQMGVRMDERTDNVNPVYPRPTSLDEGIIIDRNVICQGPGSARESHDKSLRPSHAIWRHRSGSTLAWRHQAITWTDVDLSSVRASGIHLRAISWEIPRPPFTIISLNIA